MKQCTRIVDLDRYTLIAREAIRDRCQSADLFFVAPAEHGRYAVISGERDSADLIEEILRNAARVSADESVRKVSGDSR